MLVSESFQHEDVRGFKFGYHPFARPYLFVYAFYIDGLLIDTGQRKAVSEVKKATENLPVEQIFVTHHHEDHSGNIPQLRQLHDCPAYAPAMTCEIMKAPPRMSFPRRLLWGVREPYNDLIPVSRQIKTNKYCFEVIVTPGHAPDMAVLYEPNKKWLFSADLFVNTYIGYMLNDESIVTQIESTKKVLELDFEVMFCAHNPQLNQGKEQLAKKLNFLESFYEKVATEHRQSLSANQIMRKLKLKEDWLVRTISGGQLSKLNMVKSVIRDLESKR